MIETLRFATDGFRVVYALLATLLWVMTLLFSKQYFYRHRHLTRYFVFYFITFFAVLGVFFAADLLTLFLFFEIMSFTSYVWVAQEETDAALRASKTYLAVAVIGGLSMLMGIFMLEHAFGTLMISDMREAATAFLAGEGGNFGNRQTYLYVAAALLTVGFGGKAGVFPLHIWLPKAHPAAPAPASALLSGMLTKCGIFGMLLVNCHLLFADGTWGKVILVLGTITMVLGAVSALFSVDIKRTLACSSVSQIGFITLGIGMIGIMGGHGIALSGTVFHMVNHTVLKLVLFLAAGVVYMNTHSLDLNKVRGYGRRHPFLAVAVAFGGLGLAGIPGFNGYISKTLLHESLVEHMHHLEAAGLHGEIGMFKTVEVLFLISGGLTLAYMLKLFIAIFVEKGDGEETEKKSSMTLLSGIAVCGSAVLIPVLGLTPNVIFAKIGHLAEAFFGPTVILNGEGHEIHWLAFANLKGALISVGIGVVVYLLVVRGLLMKKENGRRVYVNRIPAWIDLEESVYRPVVLYALPFVLAFFSRICDTVIDSVAGLLRATVFAPRKRKMSIWVGTRVTHMLGTAMDGIVVLLNKTIFRNHPITKSFVSVFAVSELEARQTFSLVIGSVSFGLLLAAMGLAISLIYLLF
ncbi:MAG: sodium:proton antiporter [Lachnospiraceae bacterium]|nr:sodium:proton antiporter [Lachnospiraceae bacterium]MBQ8547572.1 sodium:proton antiporter [Lachnospiraceae bacterium]